LILEYVNWMDDAWVDPVLPVSGVYTAPERPGHGLAFKEEFLKEFTLR
jgi:D-arabinonate dehydratase